MMVMMMMMMMMMMIFIEDAYFTRECFTEGFSY